jgi:hypothetical protein
MFGRVAAGRSTTCCIRFRMSATARGCCCAKKSTPKRADCGRIIDRELGIIRRFLDDLRNVVKPKPVERFAMDINAAVGEVFESMRPEGERHGVALSALR